ncbi:MAG: four helix bundle protein [Verrucomicrobia bacterium]|nr:MAG: four helix bundle protein [Verrucomicrobiota bacterium]
MTSPHFHHEKLTAYQRAIEFVAWVEGVNQEITGRSAAKEQLDRASTSILLNLAEGNGKRSAADRRRFFDIARGSAVECAACLDVFVAKNLITRERAREGKAILHEAVAMISGLISHFSTKIGEDAEGYGLAEFGDKETREGDKKQDSIRP